MDNNELSKKAAMIRYLALKAIKYGGSGHPGGSLSMADLITCLYFDELQINPSMPSDPNRDRFVLSKGHACPALYAALAMRGFFKIEELLKLRHIDGFLQGHPDMKHTPGIDMTTGSLGQGVSAACGIALAGKLQGKSYRVYTILGDGEMDEGEVWEAMMFSVNYKLSNLTMILDHNGLQIDGPNNTVMRLDNLPARAESFGLNTIEINGHNFTEIKNALGNAKKSLDRPTFIIANTVKGKGVSFMENQVGWHGKAPSEEDLAKAADELGVEI